MNKKNQVTRYVVLLRRPGAFSAIAAMTGQLKPVLHHVENGEEIQWALVGSDGTLNLTGELELTLVIDADSDDRADVLDAPIAEVRVGHTPQYTNDHVMHFGPAAYSKAWAASRDDGGEANMLLASPIAQFVIERNGFAASAEATAALNAARQRPRSRPKLIDLRVERRPKPKPRDAEFNGLRTNLARKQRRLDEVQKLIDDLHLHRSFTNDAKRVRYEEELADVKRDLADIGARLSVYFDGGQVERHDDVVSDDDVDAREAAA